MGRQMVAAADDAGRTRRGPGLPVALGRPIADTDSKPARSRPAPGLDDRAENAGKALCIGVPAENTQAAESERKDGERGRLGDRVDRFEAGIAQNSSWA